jgi:hypothetical protein
MNPLLLAAAIAAMVCTALVTLAAVVFCLGMGANAKPSEIRSLKFRMLGFALLGIAGVTLGIFLLHAGLPGQAAFASLAPTVIMVGIFIAAMLK